jgi:hypothetical protein
MNEVFHGGTRESSHAKRFCRIVFGSSRRKGACGSAGRKHGRLCQEAGQCTG